MAISLHIQGVNLQQAVDEGQMVVCSPGSIVPLQQQGATHDGLQGVAFCVCAFLCVRVCVCVCARVRVLVDIGSCLET